MPLAPRGACRPGGGPKGVLCVLREQWRFCVAARALAPEILVLGTARSTLRGMATHEDDDVDREASEIASDYDQVEDSLYENDAEDAAALDSDDDATLALFDKSQRDLVTSVVDYNLATLADLVSRKKIDLSPRYQRRFRWDAARQSKLIESFLMNVPIPPIFLNEDQYTNYAVIDGKQRLLAVQEFIRGRLKLRGLKVFDDINGSSIDDLPSRLRSIIETRATLRAIIILPQSQPVVKFEVFKRLNTGGVKLNPQEIRNSTFPGPLNDLILKLSTLPEFHRLLNITDRNKSALYREMRDAEFVLRYFAFRDSWKDFTRGMMRVMEDFMSDHQHMDAGELDAASTDFGRSCCSRGSVRPR